MEIAARKRTTVVIVLLLLAPWGCGQTHTMDDDSEGGSEASSGTGGVDGGEPDDGGGDYEGDGGGDTEAAGKAAMGGGSASGIGGGVPATPEGGSGGYYRPPGAGAGGYVEPVPVAGAPFPVDAGMVSCDPEGFCYYPDGSWCDPWGTCCRPDGSCSGGAPVAGGSGVIIGVAGGYPGSGRYPVDPDDFTDEPWQPLTNDLGDPGWRDSDDPLCTELQGHVGSHSVWTDSRGVFVLVSGQGGVDGYWDGPVPTAGPVPLPGGLPPVYADPGSCAGGECFSARIYLNDGSGWDVFYDEELTLGYLDKHLTGFDGGPLITYGWEEIYLPREPYYGDMMECGLATIEDGIKTCEPVYGVDDVFVVNDSLAYGVFEGDIITYDGNSWAPLPVVMPDTWVRRVWANETHLFATVEGAGRILMLHDGIWRSQDTRTLQSFGPIWGFDETDVWAGTSQGGLFHYDGRGWTEIPWEGDNCPWTSAIDGMWGDSGTLYFYTESKIARAQGSGVEVINSWSCPQDETTPRITSMWGNGPDDVFFTFVDSSFPRRACGIAYVVWFDGQTFHWI